MRRVSHVGGPVEFFFLRFSDVGDHPVHPLDGVSLNDLFSSADESGKGEKPRSDSLFTNRTVDNLQLCEKK
jgi:hypothetical protein